MPDSTKAGGQEAAEPPISPERLALLRALEQKVLWLSAWTIHHANHIRPNRDGLKVGGHQASSASVVTLMTALYFDVLRRQDRVAVKPHASPVYHAIQYLLGNQSRDNLIRFRALGGAQSYPSRSKDADDVDFSTGSVGLGVAMTSFAALVQDYLRLKRMGPMDEPAGRMVALVGDAEFDEGNVFEAMLEGWKHDVRNLWWIIDYNRQSLDNVISDRLFGRIDGVFHSMDWRVVTLKYGKLLQHAFREPGGDALRQWIDDCPNSHYSALTYKGGPGWRDRLKRDLAGTHGLKELLDRHDDAALHRLMTNLGGHCIETVLEAMQAVRDDRPTCFIAYTIKGFGLPFAGHKDNHAGLMNPEQMAVFKRANDIADGQEWEPFAGLKADVGGLRRVLADNPFAQAEGGQGLKPRRHRAEHVPVPDSFAPPKAERMSTQEGFGRILFEIAGTDSELARRIVTTSPDVTVSTNLGGWVNRRGIFDRVERADAFKEANVVSAQRWSQSPAGQHIELGIAENNLFIALAALGLAGPVFGERLLPIGTLYDPFICRGLDALNYACYQDARFMVVATPSGVTLAPEGGAHQSRNTPLIGMSQSGLASFEPAFVDELAVLMRHGFDWMQREAGGSIYLRLSTRPQDQPARAMDASLRAAIVEGGYWLKPPAPGAALAIVYQGAVAPEAIEAHRQLLEDVPGAGLLAITSSERLHTAWRRAQAARRAGDRAAVAPIERLLAPLAPDAALVTAIDGDPATLAWLGAVGPHRVHALGVDRFGQSGDVPDIYRYYGLDAEAILDAAAAACLGGRRIERPA
ncbi:MAG: transketolase [Alphaproteobacteria bacterium]|nr:transketolase [Alphaproteobacteria bacterium]